MSEITFPSIPAANFSNGVTPPPINPNINPVQQPFNMGAINAGLSKSLAEVLAIVGYIAPQKNVLKKADLHIAEAKKSWEEYKSAEWAAEKITVTTRTGGVQEVQYEENFKPAVYKAFMSTKNKAEYDRVKAIDCFRIETAEAKVDRYIIKMFTDDKVLTHLTAVAQATTNASVKIAVLTAGQIVEFLEKSQGTRIPIVTGMELSNTVGSLSLDRGTRVTKDSKTQQKITEDIILIKIYDQNGKKKSIRELTLGEDNIEEKKVPYCVLRNNTTPFEYAGAVTVDNILNKERFKKLFPNQVASMTSLPARKKFVSTDYVDAKGNKDANALKNAKDAEKISFAESGADKFGISENIWASLFATSKVSGKTISVSEQEQNTNKALELFRQKGSNSKNIKVK